jgi:hypothetical protein
MQAQRLLHRSFNTSISALSWRPGHYGLCTSFVTHSFRVMLRPTLSRPVCLAVKHPSGAQDQIFVTVRQLCFCSCGAPCLTRVRVCRLQLLLALASTVILGSESRGTHGHILLSQILESPILVGQVPVFIFPRNRVFRLYPQALGSLFVASYDSQGYGGGIRPRLHTGFSSNPGTGFRESESELLYDWRFTANQFVLATSPLRLTTSIFFSTEHLLS